jgi:hypothetical protein
MRVINRALHGMSREKAGRHGMDGVEMRAMHGLVTF